MIFSGKPDCWREVSYNKQLQPFSIYLFSVDKIDVVQKLEKKNLNFNQFQPSVAFHTETSNAGPKSLKENASAVDFKQVFALR